MGGVHRVISWLKLKVNMPKKLIINYQECQNTLWVFQRQGKESDYL